jgi:hypothetical protein
MIVTLQWDPPSGGPTPTGYGLERSYDEVNYKSVGNIGNVLTYDDAELQAPRMCWRSFSYYVDADLQWHFSTYSNVFCMDLTPPLPPTEMVFTIDGSDIEKSVAVTWTTSKDSEDYVLYRKMGDNSLYEKTGETASPESTDTQNPDMVVCHKVTARNQFGESAPGHEVCITSSRLPVHATIAIPGPDDQYPPARVLIDISPQQKE